MLWVEFFSHRVNGKNDRIRSFFIALQAIPNFHSIAQADPWMTEAMSLLAGSEKAFHEAHHCPVLSCF